MIRTSGLLVLLFVVLGCVAACGGDDGDDRPEPTANPTRGTDIDAYCSSVETWVDAISAIGGTTVETRLNRLSEATDAARAVVPLAPGEVRVAHEHIASAAEALLAGVHDRNPQSLAELNEAHDAAGEEIAADYADIDDESRDVEEFIERECGLTFD